VQNHTHSYKDFTLTGWDDTFASGTTNYYKTHEDKPQTTGTVTGANKDSTETRPVNMKVMFIMKCWHQSDD
jgi:hypothetical protein